MKKILLITITLLLISINSWYLMNHNVFEHYENSVLILNIIFILILMIIHIKKSQLHNTTPEQDYNSNNQQFIINDSSINSNVLIQHFPDFLCIKNEEGRWLAASDFYLDLFGLKDIDYIGKTDAELFHYALYNTELLKVSFFQDKSAWHLKKAIQETKPVVINKQKKNLEITRIPVFNEKQQEQNIILTGCVVNSEKRKKHQLELLPKAFENCHLNLMFLDKNFDITDVNTEFCLSTGYTDGELIGRPLSFIIKGKFTHLQASFFNENPRKLWSGELVCLTKTGRDFPIKLEVAALTKDDKNDESIVYFASMMDITQQKQAEKRIIKLSYYDDLTGLFNRSIFYEKLKKFITSSKGENLHLAVFIINLDRFKTINDSLGHDAGNEALKVVAQRIQELIGANDIAARLSGDEFAILMFSNQSYEQTVYAASIIAGKINQKLSEIIRINHNDAIVGSSIGISIYPEDCRNTETTLKAEILLKNADIARQNAKNKAKNSYQFYNRDHNAVSQDKLLMELNLRKAIKKDELKLCYQPQYFATNKKLCGAEVLVRWYHNNSKMIPPDEFITLAEDTGLIIEIGYWILKTACQQLKTWIDAGFPLHQISVNVSAQQFHDTNFLNSIKKALNESGLAPENLELEITESMLIGDARFIDLQLSQLKKMGVKLAIDDFGTGYSSLSYLKDFPIDMLKMDKSFVTGMTIDSKNARLASAIIEIGHSLKQLVIAEGVENQEQFDFLRKRGCDIIQGYYFSKPLDVEEMTEFLKKDFNQWEVSTKKNPFISE